MSDPTLGHDLPTDAELRSLYDAVGWTTYTDDLDRLARGLRASLRVVTARVDGALAGLARVVGDGETIVYLQDVLVGRGPAARVRPLQLTAVAVRSPA